MLELWERAVRATHHFLTDADIVGLRPLVAQQFAGADVEWWVLVSPPTAVIGFLGFANDTIDALFVDPSRHGQGGGRRLVDHAQSLAGPRALAVEVNEQNPAAVDFYKALGFAVVSRSAFDSGGRPFPILRMQRSHLGNS
jgi:putative acetyltransferase